MSGPTFVVVGAVQSSSALLQAMFDAGADVRLVATLSAEIGRQRHADYSDLAPIARAKDVPVQTVDGPEKLDEALAAVHPDVLCVFGWSRLVPMRTVSLARLGAVGFHPAPLPVGRGRHPLIWTILLGLETSSACFFRLGAAADDGDVLARRDFPVAADETASSLMRKVISAGCDAVPELIDSIGRRGLVGTPQDHRVACEWRKRSAADGRIDFRMASAMIDRHVRALADPYPGADAVHNVHGAGKIFSVEKRTRPADARYAEPGRVIAHESGAPLVASGDGAVLLVNCRFPGPLERTTWFQ